MKAIVLSGGGAKGAYEVGVWKALRKLHIKYDIVTGTSIGAINGMLMVQNDFYKCINMWKNINFELIYDNFTTPDDSQKMYLDYLNKIVDGGIDTNKILKIIDDNFDSKKLYSSKISYGIVSYNISNRKVVYSTKKNTRPDKLKQYILASATCFPVFKPTKIGTEFLIDGGYYDNLPINLAIELGADEVIAIDLGSIGFKKKLKNKSTKVTYIEPSNKLDSFLMFESNAARRMINFGYNDAMKKFGRYEGREYTFKKGTFQNIYVSYKNSIIKIAKDHQFNVGNIRKLADKKEPLLSIIEDAAIIFKVKADRIYNKNKINKQLLDELYKTEDIKIDNFDIEKIKKLFNKANITKYIYTKLKNHDKINYSIFSFFTKELTTAIYLLAISEGEIKWKIF